MSKEFPVYVKTIVPDRANLINNRMRQDGFVYKICKSRGNILSILKVR